MRVPQGERHVRLQNDPLLKDILRGQWGFDGFVQSDFGAAHSTVASAQADMDLEMPTGVSTPTR